MSRDQQAARGEHLTEAELFTLAVPPAGEPEALPRHLSECLACSRALSEWKNAMRELGEEDAEIFSKRSPQEWEQLEEKTLAAVRRTRIGRPRLSWRWVAIVAAAFLLFALALPLAKKRIEPKALPRTAELTAQDQADDALLRDVARLTRGEEGENWSSLVPEPEAAGGGEEERL